MALAKLNFDELNDKIEGAVEQEIKLIEELRVAVRQLQVKKLGQRPCRAIAPVATDGGENRLTFEPLNLEIIRVVDSNGTDLVQEVIPLSVDEAVFASYVDRIPELQKLLDKLGGLRFDDLSYLVGSKPSARSELDRLPDLRGQLRAFRDIIEWAVTLDLATTDWPTEVLLLRDGLLRTKVLKRQNFPKLDRAFRNAYEGQIARNKHRVFLLGVAKTSAVLSKLSLALLLEGVFNKEYPCYAEVPKDLEAKCYNFDRTWLDTSEDRNEESGELYQSFGRLHLVKLSPARNAPVLPVDIPVWIPTKERQVILEYLSHDALDTFPAIGYPHALQKAHEHAVMTGLEMTVLGDMMIDHLIDNMPDDVGEKLIRHVNLGRGLMKGGARHGG